MSYYKVIKADPKRVLTGVHFMDGDHACCEGAIAAGCNFVAGYPITPSTEVVERFASRIPVIGGVFIQMEDEIASSIAIQGAVWAGAKAMTVTSGPGFSLMMEHIGLACMWETPCVFVNVQRGGPSTGLPTLPGQADMMQVRYGSHGDYQVIAVAPYSVQESFELTILAFNLAEIYRVPVFVMLDECVGHMLEKLVIPKADEIDIIERRYTDLPPDKYLPFKPEADLVPQMIKAGQGYKVHIESLTHDERGYPLVNALAQDKLVRRLNDKIKLNRDKIINYEEESVEDADVVVISYGISARVSIPGIEEARKQGIKVGMFRLKVVWPFPEERIKELAKKVKVFVVVEMNLGQVFLEVERCVALGSKGMSKVVLVSHCGGAVHNPEDIYKAITEAVA